MQNPQTIPVFEILSGDEGVEEVDSIFAFEGYDFAAGSADVGVDVEGFPEVVECTNRNPYSLTYVPDGPFSSSLSPSQWS
jgi:hypothetical protein